MDKKCVYAMAICGIAMLASAVGINMIGGNAAGTSSLKSGINWSNGLPPGPGTNYFLNGFLMRTPESDSVSDNHVFAGGSLTLNGCFARESPRKEKGKTRNVHLAKKGANL